MQKKIAVLGTGRMGAPIASNLLRAEFPVSVWNRTPARAQPLADEGARLASSPSEASEILEFVDAQDLGLARATLRTKLRSLGLVVDKVVAEPELEEPTEENRTGRDSS